MVARQGARLRAKSAAKQVNGDEDDLESSSESEIEEDIGFFSPLDNVNTYISFKQALTGLFSLIGYV